ncbi:MAG TPA: sulfite exporter TauE/SafE family protein [Nevskiales bacterium]|nr:sulfite exporter TauE/SafE family protein [Nevskiales bacterium]
MSIDSLLALLAIVAVGTYFQTVTGFGLGMIVMGATSGFALAPVSVAAAVVSLVTLVNSAVALPGKLHHIDWRAARAVLVGVGPAIIAGVLLLDYLSSVTARLLQFLLGAAIIYSGVVFARRPAQLPERSSDRSFFISGFASGLFGGLFGMAGPPVIFHFYRQPLELVAIRNMLLLVFAFTSGSRTLFIAAQGRLDSEIWLLTACAVPLVALATVLGRRYPPPFAPQAMRRVACAALLVIGASLVMSALTFTGG